jgi:hypothetical protein
MKTNSGIEISTSLPITRRPLHHQVQRLARESRCVGQPGEEHAHAHQREGGGKAEHDGHHHQRQHQQAEMAVGDHLDAAGMQMAPCRR